jgi:hypothetical protein
MSTRPGPAREGRRDLTRVYPVTEPSGRVGDILIQRLKVRVIVAEQASHTDLIEHLGHCFRHIRTWQIRR